MSALPPITTEPATTTVERGHERASNKLGNRSRDPDAEVLSDYPLCPSPPEQLALDEEHTEIPAALWDAL